MSASFINTYVGLFQFLINYWKELEIRRIFDKAYKPHRIAILLFFLVYTVRYEDPMNSINFPGGTFKTCIT